MQVVLEAVDRALPELAEPGEIIGGLLQSAANLAFSWMAVVGASTAALTFAITAENFTSAIGTVIFVAYLSALCKNPLYTATQFALLTALSTVGRTFLSLSAGYVASKTGWFWFWCVCAGLGIPSLVLLAYLQRRGHFVGLEERPAGKQVQLTEAQTEAVGAENGSRTFRTDTQGRA